MKKFFTETWEPFHGCLSNCPGCKAAALIRRTGGHRDLAYYMHQEPPPEIGELHILDKPMRDEVTGEMEDYPFAFDPTFSRYRLDEPAKILRPANVLVCENGDLFAPWVPDRIIAEILETAAKTIIHNYLFLTKYPERYNELPSRLSPANFLFGAAIDSQKQLRRVINAQAPLVRYLAIDPLKEELDLQEAIGELQRKPEWIVLKSRGVDKAPCATDQKKWILAMVNICARHAIPVFMDDMLQKPAGGVLVQQLHPKLWTNENA